MSNPVLDNNSSVGFKIEGEVGVDAGLGTGGAWLDLISEDVGADPNILQLPSPIGGRQADERLHVMTHRDGRGSIIFRPRAAHVDDLLNLFFKGTSGDYFIPTVDGTDLDTATFEIDKFGTTNYQLLGTKVDILKLRSEENGPLIFEMDLIAMSAVEDGGMETDVYTGWIDGTPFMHGSMTLDATGYAWLGAATGPEVRSIEMEMSNNLDPNGFTNSITRKIIPVGMFSVTGRMVIPYNSTSAGFLTPWAAPSKFKFTMTYQDAATNSLEFIVTASIDGTRPNVSGDDSHKWLELAFHGVVDATDISMAKAKYTAAI